MIGYVTIGARDSEASGKFYDALFGAIGSERKSGDGGWIFDGPKGADGVVAVCPPFDGKPAVLSELGQPPMGIRTPHINRHSPTSTRSQLVDEE